MRPTFAFIATSRIPEPLPAIVSVTISNGSDVASPGSVVAIAKIPQPIATARAPKRSTAGAASRNIAGIEPTETKSIAIPKRSFRDAGRRCTLGSTGGPRAPEGAEHEEPREGRAALRECVSHASQDS